jgi:hypothetical protein
MPHTTRIASLALAVAALAASGCGGSKSSGKTASASQARSSSGQAQSSNHGGSPTGPLTRAELIARADAICASVNARRASLKRLSHGYVAKLPWLASYEHAAFAQLGRLIPPVSMAGDWRQIVVVAQTVTADTAKIGEYAKSNSVNAARPLFGQVGEAQERMLTTARHAGFRDCAQL